MKFVNQPIRRQLRHRIWSGKLEAPPDLDHLYHKFEEYRRTIDDGPELNLFTEATKRVAAVAFIVHKIHDVQRRHQRAWRARLRSDPQKYERSHAESSQMVEILAEAFYYNAFLLSTILEDKLKFKNVMVENIRDVRNRLIEHSEAPEPTFVWGEQLGFGPVIKPFGPRTQKRKGNEPHDDGLYVNAGRLKEKLSTSLAAFLLSKGQ